MTGFAHSAAGQNLIADDRYWRIIACYENLDSVSLRPDFCRSNYDS